MAGVDDRELCMIDRRERVVPARVDGERCAAAKHCFVLLWC
jgi:hypothetical protein